MIEIVAQEGPFDAWITQPTKPDMVDMESHGEGIDPQEITVPHPENGLCYEGRCVRITHLHTEDSEEIVTLDLM